MIESDGCLVSERFVVSRSRQRRKAIDDETITMQIEALMDSFSVEVCSMEKSITVINIKGWRTDMHSFIVKRVV